MSNFKHPLMVDNVSENDADVLIDFLKQRPLPKMTNGPKVKEFEQRWSEWLGVKHTIMVGSGSMSNDLSLLILKYLYPEGGEILVSPLGWVSDISSILFSGFTPVFCDIKKNNLSIDLEEIKKKVTDKTKAILAVSILGYNNISQELLDFCENRKIHLIEDVCEGHGATFKNKKLGSFGSISNFSYFFAHHLCSLAEGGAICTNDDNIHQIGLALRSHGMARECTLDSFKKEVSRGYENLNQDFIFIAESRNGRSQECNAVVALNQLKRLDENNKKRAHNLEIFLNHLDDKKYFKGYDLEGNSNYAFTVILNQPDFKLRDRVENKMKECGTEFRRGMSGGGNQLRQPYARKRFGELYKEFPITEFVSDFGWYLGNWPDLSKEKILWLTKEVLNKV